jgi:hypothetical protein
MSVPMNNASKLLAVSSRFPAARQTDDSLTWKKVVGSAAPTRVIGIELHPRPPHLPLPLSGSDPAVLEVGCAAYCTKVSPSALASIRPQSPHRLFHRSYLAISPPSSPRRESTRRKAASSPALLIPSASAFAPGPHGRNCTGTPERPCECGVESTPNFSFAFCRPFRGRGEVSGTSLCLWSKETQRWWGRRLEEKKWEGCGN